MLYCITISSNTPPSFDFSISSLFCIYTLTGFVSLKNEHCTLLINIIEKKTTLECSVKMVI